MIRQDFDSDPMQPRQLGGPPSGWPGGRLGGRLGGQLGGQLGGWLDGRPDGWPSMCVCVCKKNRGGTRTRIGQKAKHFDRGGVEVLGPIAVDSDISEAAKFRQSEVAPLVCFRRPIWTCQESGQVDQNFRRNYLKQRWVKPDVIL